MEPWTGEEEIQAIVEYLRNKGWLTEFKKTRDFEDHIARYTGSRFATVVNNGTVSLAVSIMALGFCGTDEVIVPDYTMIASANAIHLAGAKPVLADIDPEHLCLTPETLETAITPRTKAIMLVTLNGRSPDMNRFLKFAREQNLVVIEDAAQSLGSFYDGKHLGTFGQVGSFSFSAPKVVTTGQGGALVTDDENLHQRIQKIKDFGRARSGVDYHEVMGFNFKFTDLQAVIGIEQMKKLDWRVKRKKEMFRVYRDLLQDVPGISFIDTDLDATSPWFIDILIESGSKERSLLIEHLQKKMIGSRPFYPAIHTQPPYSDVKGSFPVSSHISERGLWLPSSSFLTDEDITRTCDEIRAFF